MGPSVRRLLLTALFLAWGGLLAVFYLGAVLPSPGRLLDHFHALLLLAVLALDAVLAGRALLRRLGLQEDGTPGIRLLHAAGLGAAVFSLAVLALGIAHALVPVAAMLLAAAPVLLFHRDLVPLARDLAGLPRFRGSPGGVDIALAAALGLAVLIALPLVFAPAASTDELVYHLLLPARYIQAHALVPIPGNSLAAFPQNAEMLYTWGLLLQDGPLPRLLHFAFGAGCVALLYAIAARAWGRRAGLLAATLFAVSPMVIFGASFAWADLQLAFYLLLALDCVIGGREPRTLLLAGIFAGAASGTKYTGLLAACVIAVGLALEGRLAFRRDAALRRGIAAFALGTALLFAPWAIRNTLTFGDPLAPFGLAAMRPSSAPAVGTGILFHRERKSGEGSPFARAVRRVVTNPARVTFRPFYQDEFSGFLPLLALPLVFFFRPIRRTEGWALFFGLGFAAPLLFLHTSARIFLPAIAAGVLVAAWVLVRASERSALLGRAAGLLVGAELLANLCLSAVLVRLSFDPVPYSLGRESRAAYLSRQLPAWEAIAWANENLPEDARVLVPCDEELLYLERSALYGTSLDRNPLEEWLSASSSPSALLGRFHEAGVTHLLWDREKRFCIPLDDARREVLGRFLAAYARTLVEKNGRAVLEVVYPDPGEAEGGIPTTHGGALSR